MLGHFILGEILEVSNEMIYFLIKDRFYEVLDFKIKANIP